MSNKNYTGDKMLELTDKKAYFDSINPSLINWDFYQKYIEIEPPFSSIGLVVYLRTYSRYIPQLKRREKWCETVLRTVEYSLSLDAATNRIEKQAEAEELFDAIFNLRVFPAGRTLWIGGTEAARKYPTSNYNCFSGETEFLTSEGYRRFDSFNDGDPVTVLSRTNGQPGWKNATVKNFGQDRLMKLVLRKLKTKREIYVTANHRWLIHSTKGAKVTECTTEELKPGMLIPAIKSGINKVDSCSVHRDAFTEIPLRKIDVKWTVESIESTERIEDVWCIVEPETQTFALADGILTRNCSYSAIDSFSSIVEGFYMLLVGAGFGFSIEKKYLDNLPPIYKDLKIYHLPYEGWVEGVPDTTIYFSQKNLAIDLLPVDLAMTDSEFDRFISPKVTEKDRGCYLIIGDSKEGWCTALKFLFWAYQNLGKIKQVVIDYSRVRPKGTPLKTFGGRASGHEALQEFFERIEAIIGEKGDQLASTQILDICNAMGMAVVVGGVRRSSEIALGDKNDSDFVVAKKNLWSDPALENKRYRTMSNNSVVLYENPGLHWFQEVMESVKNNGEPGFVAIGNANKRLKSRCITNDLEFHKRSGTNPCFCEKTWIHTEYGPRQIKDLIGKQVALYVDGSLFSTDRRGFYKTGHKTIYRLTTNEGFFLDATDNHPILTVKTQTNKNTDYEWQEIKNLIPEQKIALNNHSFIQPWTGEGTMDEGYLLGSLIGNKSVRKTGDILQYWDENECSEDSMEDTNSYLGKKQDIAVCYEEQNQYQQFQSQFFHELCSQCGVPDAKTRIISDDVEKASYDFYIGFFAGFFDANGSPQGEHGKGFRIHLYHANHDNLIRVQRMLLRVGINSKIYWHQLVISKDNLFRFVKLISLKNTRKSKLLNSFLSQYKRKPYRDAFVATIKSIEPIGDFDVYDCSVPSIHRFDANGIVVHNCAEIMLDSKGVCNLSEVNIAAHIKDGEIDTELLERSVRLATRIGSRMTCVDLFHPEWDAVQKRDRLLGVSLTGIMTAVDLINEPSFSLEKLFKYLQKIVDSESFTYHDHLGIPRPLLASCIKPSGTLSLLPGVSPGIHRDYAPYYLRRVRVSKSDPIALGLRSLGIPCVPENGQGENLDAEQCRTWVFTFPIRTNAPIRSIDESAIVQLERYKLSMQCWSQHSTSVTISVEENEWDEVAHWLYKNYDDFVGVSFLPKFDSHNSPYPQLPMESCDQEKYEELAALMPSFTEEEFLALIASFEVIYEEYELDSGCDTGACPVR